MKYDRFIVPPNKKIQLEKDYEPSYKDNYFNKAEAKE